MSEASTVKSVVRALRLIEALNQAAVISLEHLHEATGLPKPTLVRLLETLVAEGYVFHVSRREGYALADRIVELSRGFRQSDAIVDVARPLLEAFTRRHKWHVSLGTLDVDAIRVRFNTKRISPYAIDQLGLNARVGLFASALGRAYLAFCSDAERGVLLDLLEASPSPEDAMARDRSAVDEIVALTRRQGYATVPRPASSRIQSFAIPILRAEGREICGALALVYFRSTMSEAQAVRAYLSDVTALAEEIVAGLTAQSG